MKPQIHLVIISIISSIILLSGILFYKFVYPRKRIPPLLLILLLTLLPLVSILRPGSYESGDLSIHATRAMSFYNILFQEHTLPRWSPELNLGYGDAYFQFIYILPYVLISLFHFIGFSFVASVKLLVGLSYVFSGIVFYLFIKKEFGQKAAVVGTIFYQFAPYHLVDMHFRVSVAETLSFAFIPLIFYVTKLFIEKISFKNLLFTTLAICGLLLSHQALFTITMPFVLVYFFINLTQFRKDKKNVLLSYIGALLLAMLLTAFYWLPILSESKFIYQSLGMFQSIFIFTPPLMLLYSPWRYGLLFQGHYGELSYIIGYTQLLVIFLAFLFLVRKKIKGYDRVILLFSLISVSLLVFMMLPFSQQLWKFIPLINNFQFTYRLLSMVCFFTSLIAAIVGIYIKNKNILIALCFITVGYTILNWGNRGNVPEFNDAYLKKQLLTGPTVTGSVEPTAPRWVDPKKIDFKKRPLRHLEVINGNAQFVEIERKPRTHTYLIAAETKTYFKENTFYFPGWELKIDQKHYLIDYDNNNYPGVITFSLDKGLYRADLVFTDTPIRSFANRTSVFTLLVVLCIYLYLLVNTLRKH